MSEYNDLIIDKGYSQILSAGDIAYKAVSLFSSSTPLSNAKKQQDTKATFCMTQSSWF